MTATTTKLALCTAILTGLFPPAGPPDPPEERARVTGVGGVFLHTEHPYRLARWYADRLGIGPLEEIEAGVWTTEFLSRDAGKPAKKIRLVWSVMPRALEEAGPGTVRINYHVPDLDGLVARLRTAGEKVERAEEWEHGKFAWLRDPDGNLVELYQDRILHSPGTSAAGAPDSLPPLSSVERDAILKELRTYYEDFSARDWERFARHFWPGATLTTVWQPPGEEDERVVVTTVADFVRQAPQGPGSQPIFEERMAGAEVDVRGNLALVWAQYQARFGSPDNIQEWSGVDAFTLMKHGGRWRIVALAYTPDGT